MYKLTVLILASFLTFNVFAKCEIDIRVNDYPPLYYQDDGVWMGWMLN